MADSDTIISMLRSEVAQLEFELRNLEQVLKLYTDEFQRGYEARDMQTRPVIEHLRSSLTKYGVHKDGCTHLSDRRCTCGLTEAIHGNVVCCNSCGSEHESVFGKYNSGPYKTNQGLDCSSFLRRRGDGFVIFAAYGSVLDDINSHYIVTEEGLHSAQEVFREPESVLCDRCMHQWINRKYLRKSD